MTRSRVAVVALALLTLVACGGDTKVGSDKLLNVKDQLPDRRLGENTTTTPAPSTTVLPNSNLGIRNTTVPKPTTTVPNVQVTINADRSGAASQFDPNNVTVFPKFQVRWVNGDSVPRSVVFTDRRSPSIPPGGSWSTSFDSPGTYNYQDGTRPYAVGSVTVVPR